MSAVGCWRPIVDQPPGGTFALPLRNYIANRFFDGAMPSAGNSFNRPGYKSERIDATPVTLAWLQGLVDAGVEEADELLAALRKYGAIEVWFVN